jgi:cytochrome c
MSASMLDSWTFNKIAGAVLGTALMVFGLKELAGEIYHAEAPSHEKPGFMIEVAEATETTGGEAAAEVKGIGALLATADAAAGANEAKACGACHDFTKGGPNKSGPNLWDVVERPVASAAGFAYSDGVKALSAQTWTYDSLNQFISNPKAFAKGTKMAFGGLKNDAKRANLIAYLASLSDAPKPFPAP